MTGAGSLWAAGTYFSVGSLGSGNRVVVSEGGSLRSDYGSVGDQLQSQSNQVWVTGTNSSWSNATGLYVGGAGSGNRLMISNGGALFVSGVAYLGLAASSSNNIAVVTGTNSRWSAAHDLDVGEDGSFNQLVISNGGNVINNGSGRVGATGNDNLAVVTGASSLWSNSGGLYVGSSGSGNLLIISNNGVVAAQSTTIAYGSTASNNVLTVAGGSLIGTNAAGTLLTVGRGGQGTLNLNGGTIVASQLFVTNNGPGFTNSKFNFNYGDLTTFNGSIITQAASFIIGNTAGQTATWAMVGGINSLTLGLGSDTLLGNVAGSRGVVTVSGASTVWTNGGELYVGENGTGSQLLVGNGAAVLSASGFVGHNASASNHEARITGAGSQWNVNGNVFAGYAGAGNRLVVSNGGLLVNQIGYLGVLASASSNEVVVTGNGSIWSNRFDLYVGNSGAANRLIISNGATVFASTNVILGLMPGATNNRIVVDGGTLRAQNPNRTGTLDLRRGTNQLNGGTIDVDQLLITNSAGVFQFNGGTLNTRFATVANGQPFTVGNGASTATYHLVGTSTNSFANGLVISSNAVLTGSGVINASVTSGGTIAPGNSAGSLRLNSSLTLLPSATVAFEIGGLIATNEYDQINITNDSFVAFAGTLSLSLLNNFVPATTDTFTLMTYGARSGVTVFTNAPDGGRVLSADHYERFTVTYTSTNLVAGNFAFVDSDGDGQPDYAEALAGTDLNDPRSALAITAISLNASNHVLVDFQFVIAKAANYRIEYSTNHLATWTQITNAPTLGNPSAGIARWTDDGSLTGGLPVNDRSYRVRLLP